MGNTFKLGNYVNAIFQDASNNVGIGGSPSGSYKLEVTGTSNFTSALRVSDTTGFAVGSIAGYRRIQYSGTSFSLLTNADGYANLLAAGLTLSGDLNIAGQIISTYSGQSISIRGASTASVRIQLQNNNIGNSGVAVESSTGGDQFSGTTGYAMAIGTYTARDFFIGTNGVQRFKISSTGSATFTADIAATELNGTNAVTLNKAGANGIGDGPFYRYINSTNAAQFLRQLNASSGEDLWTYTTSTAWTKVGNTNAGSGAYTPLSDINKKKDFELSTLGLDAILGLKPTLYRMKSEDESEPKQLGFIAQEVQEFIPQAYVEQGEEDGKFIGLNYNAITATLVKAVQELSAQNQDLKSRLDKAGL